MKFPLFSLLHTLAFCRVLHASLGLPLNPRDRPIFNPQQQRSPGDGESAVFLTPSAELDEDLAMALRMSEMDHRARQEALDEEEKIMQQILELSLREK